MNNNSLFEEYSNSNSKLYDIQNKFYYPIDKIYYNDKNIPYDFKIGKLISSQGAYGKIYDSCEMLKESSINSNNCDYILKKIIYDEEEFNGDIDDFINEFENEVYIQEKVAMCGLTSPIILAYEMIDDDFCELGFIMKRYEMTLKDYLNDFTVPLDNKYESLDIAYGLLFRLQMECNVLHHDSHLNNFMFESILNVNSLKLIDFGLSTEKESDEPLNKQDFKIFNSSLFSDIKDKKLSEILRIYWNKL